jgi:hypothetical protein
MQRESRIEGKNISANILFELAQQKMDTVSPEH